MSSLGASIRAQRSVIFALFLREMNRKYANSRIGFALAFVDPIIHISIMSAFRYFIRGHTTRHGIPLLLFVLTGYLVWWAFRQTATEISSALQQNKQMMMMPQVNFLDVLAARAMVSVFTLVCVAAVLSVGISTFSPYPPPKEPVLVIYCVVMGIWMGIPFGIIMGVSLRFFPILSYVYGVTFRIGMYCSGAMFMADELPRWLHPYLAWNPIFHVCELIRTAWIPNYTSPIANPYYPVICAFMASFAALLLERATHRIKFV
jgi:capsular polysaccharide transport system permease protein